MSLRVGVSRSWPRGLDQMPGGRRHPCGWRSTAATWRRLRTMAGRCRSDRWARSPVRCRGRTLEQSGNERVRELLDLTTADGLLVQNLENVQGDERDVMIRSIGFSAQPVGGENGPSARQRVPMNFGPLNQKGGERRLNVSVTRAREEVMVFCSFDPDDMTVGPESPAGSGCSSRTSLRRGTAPSAPATSSVERPHRRITTGPRSLRRCERVAGTWQKTSAGRSSGWISASAAPRSRAHRRGSRVTASPCCLTALGGRQAQRCSIGICCPARSSRRWDGTTSCGSGCRVGSTTKRK